MSENKLNELDAGKKCEEEMDLLKKLKKLKGRQLLVITNAVQLNLLGQVFRPIFCGTLDEISDGHITLSPVNVKMVNAPFYIFPFPLSIPLERITAFSTEVPCDLVYPLT